MGKKKLICNIFVNKRTNQLSATIPKKKIKINFNPKKIKINDWEWID
jgi:hypothetical protein